MAKDFYEVTFENEKTGEKYTRGTMASSERAAIKNIKSEGPKTQTLINWNAKRKAWH